MDPVLLKRRLFEVPLERVEDPALDRLFREKQAELDSQLTLLLDRQTARFLPGSLALYGGAQPWLVELATTLLARLPEPPSRRRRGELDSRAVLKQARRELTAYRRAWPDLQAKGQKNIEDILRAKGETVQRISISDSDRVEFSEQIEVVPK